MSALQHSYTAVSRTLTPVEDLMRIAYEQIPIPAHTTAKKRYQLEAWRLLTVVSHLSDENVANDEPLSRHLASQIRTVEMSVSMPVVAQAKTLACFMGETSYEMAEHLLFLHLKHCLSMLNIQRRPTYLQILDAVSIVISEFSDLSLSDVVLCLKNIRTGAYGSLYENFSTEKLCEFLRLHREEKATFLERQHKNEKRQPENVLATIRDHAPDMWKTVTQIVESVTDLERQKNPHAWGETEYNKFLRGQLSPVLPRLSAAETEELIAFYEKHSNTEIANWVRTQKKCHDSKRVS